MCLIIKHKISEIIIYVDTFTEIGKGLESCDLLYYLDLYFGELLEDKRVIDRDWSSSHFKPPGPIPGSPNSPIIYAPIFVKLFKFLLRYQSPSPAPRQRHHHPGDRRHRSRRNFRFGVRIKTMNHTFIKTYFSDERDHYDLRTPKYDGGYLNNSDQAILDDFQYNAWFEWMIFI